MRRLQNRSLHRVSRNRGVDKPTSSDDEPLAHVARSFCRILACTKACVAYLRGRTISIGSFIKAWPARNSNRIKTDRRPSFRISKQLACRGMDKENSRRARQHS